MKGWIALKKDWTERCEICGAEIPVMRVYDVEGRYLGCETCLTIYDEGRIRL